MNYLYPSGLARIEQDLLEVLDVYDNVRHVWRDVFCLAA